MASPAIERITERADRAIATLRNARAKARASEARMVSALEAVAGGGAAGFVDGYLGEPKLFGLPAVPIVSGAALVLGLAEALPGSEHLAAIGNGGFAYAVGSAAFKKGQEYA
ncbi:MAG: hypothetical protein WC372_09815 [Candidatus Neomarinimicrobiota bacterium]|jgi:hypothetical protein